MRTDSADFEIFRHRISTIADEGSAVLAMVSSSPVASEANDCNVAIMDATGAAVAIGPGLNSHGTACMMTARYVASNYADNPGFGAGDMFIANDPYHCSPHQTCLAMVTPIMWEGELVAWVGAGIHLSDMGGPVPGQVSVGAQSIFQEALPFLPIRIVEGGKMRRDLEVEVVRRSRIPNQVSLDLRALIAACNRLGSRLEELLRARGAAVLTAVLADTAAYARAHLNQRLESVPDGVWESSVWLDYPEADRTTFYECRVRLTKTAGRRLLIDLSESSPQAPAVINCGEPGLIAGVLGAAMTTLGYGLPLCPEAILQVCEIRSTPGTFVHATWPAGCSKATTAASHAVREAVNLALGKMLLASPATETRAMAGCGGFLPVVDIDGTNQRGERFAAPLLDVALSVGYGGMIGKDGIDAAGSLGSPFASIANVEAYEYRYPILYLWRAHQPDSGGLGRYRGGRGVRMAIVPHRTDAPLAMVAHGLGTSLPSSLGLGGGQPGATTEFVVRRDSGTAEVLAGGRIPRREEELGGAPETLPGLARTALQRRDVLLLRNNGGGGIGDPLDREPQDVLHDLTIGAVSAGSARDDYGVVTTAGGIDPAATDARRTKLRAERAAPGSVVGDGAAACAGCGSASLRERTMSLGALGQLVVPHGAASFEASILLCASCGRQRDVRLRESASSGPAGTAR
ncbi:MAG: N-methylhydantoinase [Chloroflexota bacterium]|nr:N-methylhydantoinase [Chloroflexota bacterium]